MIHRATAVPHRQQFSVVKLNVGVGRIFQSVVGQHALGHALLQTRAKAGAGRLIGSQALRLDPAIAVTDLALLKMHSMQHAIAIKPVVFAFGCVLGHGSIANIHAAEIVWNFANHFKIGCCQFVLNGTIAILQIGVVYQVGLGFDDGFKSHGFLQILMVCSAN